MLTSPFANVLLALLHHYRKQISNGFIFEVRELITEERHVALWNLVVEGQRIGWHLFFLGDHLLEVCLRDVSVTFPFHISALFQTFVLRLLTVIGKQEYARILVDWYVVGLWTRSRNVLGAFMLPCFPEILRLSQLLDSDDLLGQMSLRDVSVPFQLRIEVVHRLMHHVPAVLEGNQRVALVVSTSFQPGPLLVLAVRDLVCLFLAEYRMCFRLRHQLYLL